MAEINKDFKYSIKRISSRFQAFSSFTRSGMLGPNTQFSCLLSSDPVDGFGEGRGVPGDPSWIRFHKKRPIIT